MSSNISNDDLKRAQLPGPRSSWDEIQIFALTFNGYERIGVGVGALANGHREAGTVPTDLDELRGCLFFEQMRHVWALIERTRAALEKMPLKWSRALYGFSNWRSVLRRTDLTDSQRPS